MGKPESRSQKSEVQEFKIQGSTLIAVREGGFSLIGGILGEGGESFSHGPHPMPSPNDAVSKRPNQRRGPGIRLVFGF
jgi:hypothetical protein